MYLNDSQTNEHLIYYYNSSHFDN